MKTHGGNNGETARRLIFLACLFMIFALPDAGAEGVRNIASLTVDNYFNGDVAVEAVDVFLIRLSPAFSIQARLANIDTFASGALGSVRNAIGLGPVINFSENVYADIRYSLGADLGWIVFHEGEINLTYESSSSTLSCGARGTLFSAGEAGGDPFWYVIPTVSGSLLFDRLYLFLKLFVSIDSVAALSSSIWGETGWAFTPAVTGIAGFTVSAGDTLGYSIIVGAKFKPEETVSIGYKFQFRHNSISYGASVGYVYGIQNVLILDIQF